MCAYISRKASVNFNRNCLSKMTNFSMLQSITFTVKVAVPQQWCKINTLSLHTTNRKCHVACPFVPHPRGSTTELPWTLDPAAELSMFPTSERAHGNTHRRRRRPRMNYTYPSHHQLTKRDTAELCELTHSTGRFGDNSVVAWPDIQPPERKKNRGSLYHRFRSGYNCRVIKDYFLNSHKSLTTKT